MNKLFSIILILSIGYSAYSQPANVVKANSYYKEGKYDLAMEAIDQAIEHPDTKNEAKTWKYRGDIYFKIASSPEFASMAAEADYSTIVFESYKRALQLDKSSGRYTSEIKGQLGLLNNTALNLGVQLFNERKYAEAAIVFTLSAESAQAIGVTDTLALYNIALSYEKNEQYDEAINYYEQCYDLEYRGADICNFIIYLYQKQNKDAAVRKKIEDCRKRYPNDYNLLISELNMDLKDGDYQSAMQNLESAIINEPNNAILYFSLGSVNDGMGNYDKAILAYQEALRLKPDYFDPAYNLGALYYNQGVEKNNSATNESEMAEAIHLFQYAKQYLTIAIKLKPGDQSTLSSLEELKRVLGE